MRGEKGIDELLVLAVLPILRTPNMSTLVLKSVPDINNPEKYLSKKERNIVIRSKSNCAYRLSNNYLTNCKIKDNVFYVLVYTYSSEASLELEI